MSQVVSEVGSWGYHLRKAQIPKEEWPRYARILQQWAHKWVGSQEQARWQVSWDTQVAVAIHEIECGILREGKPEPVKPAFAMTGRPL